MIAITTFVSFVFLAIVGMFIAVCVALVAADCFGNHEP